MTSKKNNGGFKPLKIIDEQLREVLQTVETKSKTLEKNEWYRKAKRLQKDLEKRAKGVQKDVEKRAKGVQKDLEKRTKGVRRDLEKRAKDVHKDINKRRDNAYHLAGLATKSEVDALNRKLRQINQSVSAA